jgi:ribonuclease III
MPQAPTFHRTKFVSIYMDCENVSYAKLALRLIALAHISGELKTAKAYAKWRNQSLKSELNLHRLDFDCIDVPSTEKNSVDNKLISDCCREFESKFPPHILIIVAGDKDYASLIKRLRTKGVRVIIVANRYNASRKLLSLIEPEDVYYVDTLAA